MKVRIKSKVIAPHVKGCNTGWSGVIKGEYFGNYNANPNAEIGRHHLWYKCTCNNTQCTGIKAVHSSVIAEA